MKKIGKLFITISLVIITIFKCSSTCFADVPAITLEQQAYLSNYVRTYVREASRYGYVCYDTGHDVEKSLKNIPTIRGQIAFCCASFCAAMLYQALGVEKILTVDQQSTQLNARVTSFFSPRKNELFKELTNNDILMPGDIIAYDQYTTHVLMYIGVGVDSQGKSCHQLADVHSAESKKGKGKLINLNFRPDNPIRYRDFILNTKYGQVSRLDPSVVADDWEPKKFIEWANGSKTEVDGSFVITDWGTGEELWYNGIADMVYEGEAPNWLDIIVETLGDILDYLIGAITYIFRMPIIGAGVIAETLLNWILQIFSGEPTLKMITIEDIIFNKVSLLNINIFQSLAGNATSGDGIDIINILRGSIATWYYIFRYIVIIGMLLTLIYLGVRMAITAIAEDKAKYKKLLLDWLISFVIIFVIHYYIVIVVQGNSFLLNLFEQQITKIETNNTWVTKNIDSSVIARDSEDTGDTEQTTGAILSTQNGLFNKLRDLSYSFKLTEGFLGAIAYVVLVYYTIKFCIKYVKRMFNIYILILLSPLIAISYAIDKIKDGKSQSLSRWMKELGFGVFVQSVHALIYVIFVSIILIQIENANIFTLGYSCILMFITFNFMDKAEKLFEGIFGIKSDSISSATAAIESITTVKSTLGVVKAYGTIGKVGLGVIGKGINKIPVTKKIKDNWNEAKYGDSKKNKGKNSSVDKEIEKEKAKAKEQENKLKAERKQIRKEAIKAVSSLVNAIPQLADNPAHGIGLLIAGITGLGSTKKKIRTYQKKSVKTYKADSYAKVKALNAKRDAEIELKQQISTLIQDESTIIGKGFAKDATQEEREKAVQILEEQIGKGLKEVSQDEVKKSVNKAIIANNGKITQEILDDIMNDIEEKQEKSSKENSSNNAEQDSESTEQDLEKKESRKESIDETLVDMMTEQAFSKSKGKQAFTGATALMIKQAKERLQKEIEKEASNSKMSKNETRENLERGLRQELEVYVKKKQEKDAILRDIKKEDLVEMVTLAMNSENSILRQLDNENGIKSTSNENTNVGSQAGDGKSKVYANVDMKSKEDKTEDAGAGVSGTNTSGTLKEIDFEERLKGEMRPVLEAAERLRKANAEVRRTVRQDSRIKINDIISELQRRKEEEE